MDEIVAQAMAKWPNVPHCYGWLALDARGAWRMRDERAQQLGMAGEPIRHAALLGFINRNYAADERGCWYFQNGPQRVYLNLAATPFIVHTDPAQGLVLQTGEPLGHPGQAFMTEAGNLILRAGARIAQVDDRDLGQLMAMLELDGGPASDEALLDWIERPDATLRLALVTGQVEVQRIDSSGVARRFGFVRAPVAT